MSARRALVLSGLAAGAVAVGARAAERRWHAATDDPDPFRLPDGDELKIETSDGAVLATTVAGDGPDVVLSHCWVGHRGFWAPVARRLIDAGHRVVLYDQRGHGSSTDGSDEYSLSRLGADLRQVIEAVDASDSALVGHSMGGMAAQACLIEHPGVASRVRRLVLVATACHGLGDRPQRVLDVLAHPRFPDFVSGRRGRVIVRGAFGRRPQYPHIEGLREGFAGVAGPVRAGAALAMSRMDHRQALASISVPTQVVVGQRDTLTPPRLARVLASSIPTARLLEIPDAGHTLPLEVPDLLASLIAYRQ